MKKIGVFLLLLGMLFIPGVSADLEISAEAISPVIVSEFGNPATYELTLKNTGQGDNVQLYTIIGVDIIPRSGVDLPSGTSKLEIDVYASDKLKESSGSHLIEYYIKGDNGIFRSNLELKVTKLEDAISITTSDLAFDDESLEVRVKNIKEANIGDLEVEFSSPFFTHEDSFSLGSKEEVNISIPIDKELSRTLTAGSYILTADVAVNDVTSRVDGVINYVEKRSTSGSNALAGFLIRKNTIYKQNDGNVPAVDTITVKKDIVSRLFTTYSFKPDRVERSGFVVEYEWNKQLQPGETWSLDVRTNYTLPFIFVIIIIIAGFLVHIKTGTNVVVSKRITRVRTKGGEFALRVHLSVKARRHAENIHIVDRIPGMTKLYEKGGMPDKVDHDKRRLVWNLEKLRAGEERVFTYVIYSKINVVGKFELPTASAAFDTNGKREHVVSNRAMVMSEISRAE